MAQGQALLEEGVRGLGLTSTEPGSAKAVERGAEPPSVLPLPIERHALVQQAHRPLEVTGKHQRESQVVRHHGQVAVDAVGSLQRQALLAKRDAALDLARVELGPGQHAEGMREALRVAELARDREALLEKRS